jgi:hypothetical protein
MHVGSFLLRVKGQERRLFANRELYVGIRRDWQKGSRLLFVDKTLEDEVIGSGIFDAIMELEAMSEQEKKLCLQNNWYGRIILERVERFLPPVPVRGTPLAETKPALLHGLEITEEQTEQINGLATSRVIS